MNFLSYDGTISRILNKIADFFILNMLIILCSIPLITIGTALTAAHYVSIKRYRGSDESITKLFFRSFKDNFKQSTIIWLIVVALYMLISLSYRILMTGSGTMTFLASAMLLSELIVVTCMVLWIFPLQSRFINKISTTIKFSFFMCIKNFWRTALMFVELLIPVFVVTLSMKLSVLVFLFGISVPVYLNAITYDRAFRKQENIIIEREKAEQPDEDPEVVREREVEMAYQSMEQAYNVETKSVDETSSNITENTLNDVE